MTIAIGDASLSTRRPRDLDAALIDLTGCNASEVRNWLGGDPMPGHVAAALRPFLIGDNQPDLATLAAMIATAGAASVASDVARLYGEQPAAEEA